MHTSKAGVYNIMIIADRKDTSAKHCNQEVEYERIIQEKEYKSEVMPEDEINSTSK